MLPCERTEEESAAALGRRSPERGRSDTLGLGAAVGATEPAPLKPEYDVDGRAAPPAAAADIIIDAESEPVPATVRRGAAAATGPAAWGMENDPGR